MRRRDGRPGCEGSGLGCQRSSGLIQSPGLQEEEVTHQAGSYSRLKTKDKKSLLLAQFISTCQFKFMISLGLGIADVSFKKKICQPQMLKSRRKTVKDIQNPA